MEVKPGYKQTEMGIMPNDWEEISLNKLVTEFRGGAPLAPNDFIDNGFKVLPKSGVGRGGKLFIEKDKLQYCKTEYAANHKSNQVDNLYTIVVLRDLVPSGPNIGLMVKIDSNDRYILAQGVYGFKANGDLIDPNYLIHFSNTSQYRKVMNNIMVGSTQVHITNTAFLKIIFSLPPTKQEQTAISQALSDTDELISSLDKLIAKKRNIKQGAMQQLLTGKKRLPGFSGEWELKKLGNIANVTKLAGFEYSKYFNSYRDGGEIIVIRGTNITNNKLDLEDVKLIPRSVSAKLSRSKLFINDIVFAYVGTIGPVYLIGENDKFHLGPNTCKITVSDSILANYLLIYFTSWLTINEITEKTSIGAQPSLSMSKIRQFKINFPISKEEQTAIVQSLSDMDSEIETLEKKRDKYKAIKQGMMQELLTGKTRLI